jgi:ArsR family transcriptional regulator
VTSPRVADLLAVGRQLRADLLSLQVEMLTDLRAQEDADSEGGIGGSLGDAPTPHSDQRQG